jgi:hypothetical protein
VDERIRNKLKETSDSLSLHTTMPPSRIEEAFNFNARIMDSTSSEVLSQYTIMLAQYLITLQSRFNTARVIASQRRKVLDRRVKDLLQEGGIKGSTLKERERSAIASSPELLELENEYDIAAAERDLLDGVDKPIIELINALKSELRRRAEERQYTNRERG